MHIGYDITPISTQPSGVGNYTLYLLSHLLQLGGEHDYLLLSNRRISLPGLPPTARLRELLRPAPSRLLWMQWLLPRELRAEGVQLCHYPNSIAPIFNPCPYVVTIHDMTLSLMPAYHPWRKRVAVRPLIPLIARRAQQVITVSESARRDIVRLLRLSPERVSVIPEAAAALFQPASAAEQARVRARYQLQTPYVLYVGTLEPRKNLVRLLRAWQRLRQRRAIPHRLVIVGARGWKEQPIYDEVRRLGCAEEVRFTGYVPRADLPGLYSAADVFAFPSLYEGFGLPIIEAMACGTAVLTSDTPALLEVAGDAALHVDPYEIQAIEAGLERLLGDAALRQQLRERSLQRASRSSWHNTALQTLQVYQQVLEGRQPAPADAELLERI